MNAAAIAVENARLHQRLLVRARFEQELQHARDVQRNLLPSRLPAIPGYSFFVDYESAEVVGGDYYGFFELPHRRLVIAIGDVSGKGMPAALLMARLSSDVRSAFMQTADPADALRLLNATLCEAGVESRFVTMLLMVLDSEKHVLRLANAGHPRPLLRRGDGRIEEIDDGNVAMPLSITTEPAFAPATTEIALDQAAAVLAFTDGLTEAVDEHGSLYGSQRVRDRFAAGAGDAATLGRLLLEDLRTFAAAGARRDDTTLVCLARGGS